MPSPTYRWDSPGDATPIPRSKVKESAAAGFEKAGMQRAAAFLGNPEQLRIIRQGAQ